MRPIWLSVGTLNHIAPSGPGAMSGPTPFAATGNSVTRPSVVTRPILLPPNSTNHMVPSGPAFRRRAPLVGVGMGTSILHRRSRCAQYDLVYPPQPTTPHLARASFRQGTRAVRQCIFGTLPAECHASNSIGSAFVEPHCSVRASGDGDRQLVRMGPAWVLEVPADGIANSLISPAGVMRRILLAVDSVNQTTPSGPIPRTPGSADWHLVSGAETR
jgi:hypothetical protein